jgi:hypothetical protein
MLIENKLHGPRTAANSRAPTRPGSPAMNGQNGAGQATFASSSALNGHLNGSGSGGFTPSNGYGLDSFLKSRAPSVGPEGLSGSTFTGYQTPGGYGFDPTLGGAFPGGLGETSGSFMGFGAGGELSAMGGDGGPAFDSLMVDDVLSANGFWSSMLMVRCSFSPPSPSPPSLALRGDELTVSSLSFAFFLAQPGFGGPLAGLSGGSGTYVSLLSSQLPTLPLRYL